MQITINLPEAAKNILEMEAVAHSRSLEDEVVATVLAVTDERKKRGEQAWENMKKLRKKMLAERGGVLFPDSTEIIRESRENDH